MGKRFTETDKWKDEWFLSLDNDTRILWLYCVDNCTKAAILKKNFKLMNFCCNADLNEESFLDLFKGRIIDKGSYYFIPKFLTFQYPKGLTSNKPAIVAVRNELKEKGLWELAKELFNNDYYIIEESLFNDSSIVKDKDKDKDKDKEKDKKLIYQDILNYLNEKTGKQFRINGRKNISVIDARLNEGYNIDDFKKVIDIKTAEWINDQTMEKHLCPETLFSPKFEKYLNQKYHGTINNKKDKPKSISDLEQSARNFDAAYGKSGLVSATDG